jgi:hypothetical protein
MKAGCYMLLMMQAGRRHGLRRVRGMGILEAEMLEMFLSGSGIVG